MRHLFRVAILLSAAIGSLFTVPTEADQSNQPAAPSANGSIPLPANVKAEGLPPIPTSIAEALAP